MRFIFALLCVLPFCSLGQNLVPNPSFELEGDLEKEVAYPTCLGEYWQHCNGGLLYTVNFNRDFFWLDQPLVTAFSGTNYAGLFFYRDSVGYRDFLKIKLNQPLAKGEIYKVGLYLIPDKTSNSDSRVKEIGFHFSKNELQCDTIFQLKTPTLKYVSKDYLEDKDNWTLVTNDYIAEGWETHLTIGYFGERISRDGVPLNNNEAFGFSFQPQGKRADGAAYFIDDVFVIPEKDYLKDISSMKFEKGKTLTLNHIQFETDKSNLLTSSFTELDKLVEILNKNSSSSILIRGHTDNTGTEDYNQQLSLERANAVMAYLINKGIDAKRINTWGFGSTRPLVSNTTEEGRTMNRRVEIQVK